MKKISFYVETIAKMYVVQIMSSNVFFVNRLFFN